MRTRSFYFVVFCLIAPFYALPPFSWAYVAYSLWYWPFSSYSTFKMWLFYWCILEVIFSVYYHLQANRISTTVPEPHAVEFDTLSSAFKRVLQAGMAGLPLSSTLESLTDQAAFDEEQSAKERGSVPPSNSPLYSIEPLQFDDPRAVDHREYMRTWFYRKPWEEIHAHEVRQWLYWSIFNAAMPAEDSIPAEHKALIEESLALLQQRSGAIFKKGSNPKCKPLRPTIDPVLIRSRPLFFYAGMGFMNRIARIILIHFYDFEYRKQGHFEYLIRKPLTTNCVQHRPLVFIHGLGLGLLHYWRTFQLFSRNLSSRHIMLPIQPQISQDIFHPRFLIPSSPKESARHLSEAIVSLGWDKCGIDLLSHSNGTFFHTWMLKYHPHLVKRSCLVDPVSFCTWEGDLCYNFFYRPCWTGTQILINYFVCTELGVANVLQRHFDWISNSLWFEDIPDALDPDKTMIVLGGQDILSNMERVYRYLRSHGLTKCIRFDPEGQHGTAMSGAAAEAICRWLQSEAEPQKTIN